jgi:hypothetical protein
MSREIWVAIFWILALIYFIASMAISDHPLWVRVLGLIVVIMWGLLTPIIGKRKEKQEE